MRKALAAASVIIPLLITAALFKWSPTSQTLPPVVIMSVLLGWIWLGFSLSTKRWLKVVLLVIYPFAMFVAVMVVMITVYGVPGL